MVEHSRATTDGDGNGSLPTRRPAIGVAPAELRPRPVSAEDPFAERTETPVPGPPGSPPRRGDAGTVDLDAIAVALHRAADLRGIH